MNMVLHGIKNTDYHFRNADTLEKDWPTNKKFDAVVMNPPYSLKWSGDKKLLEDPRFKPYGVLPPASKADYLFIEHGLSHLSGDGTMAVVVPHGVLFRGNKEGQIRQKLLENNLIDAVIGLPSNLFYSASIPVAVLVLKKNRKQKDVMFIDASKEFQKEKKQNYLTAANVDKIVKTYTKRESIERYSAKVELPEIEDNDYNLNIPRYVDTFVPEPEINLGEILNHILDDDKEIQQTSSELSTMLSDLTSEDDELQSDVNDFAVAMAVDSLLDRELAMKAIKAAGGDADTVRAAINKTLQEIIANGE